MKVEFLVDIVLRDVQLALAACGAAQPDLAGLITPTFFADGERRWTMLRSRHYAADVLVTPYYNADRTLELLARAQLAGARLVHFPSEQFFSRKFEAEKLNTACAAAYRRQVNAVFVWGEYYAKRLVENSGYPPERIYEVGSPRIEKARIHADSDRDQGARPTKVLFVSDYKLADLETEQQRRQFKKTYKVDVTAADVQQIGDERRYMIETAVELSGLEGFEVRIRPHPGEKQEAYLAACDGGALQFADPLNAFTEDVRWADVAVVYTSTSIFEIMAARRMFLSLRKTATPPGVATREATESLYRIHTRAELLEALRNPDKLRSDQAQLLGKAGFYIGNIGGSYDPAAAICSALRHSLKHSPLTALMPRDQLNVAWGVIRSAIKYSAYRMFASAAWRNLGLWQPVVVRRRLSPGYILTDQVIEDIRGSATADHPRQSGPSAITWSPGQWCWQPQQTNAAESGRGKQQSPAIH